MKIVFMGSGELGAPALNLLAHQGDIHVVSLVTQPDRPGGRSRNLLPCPLKVRAESLGIPVFSPEKIGNPDAVAHLQSLQADLFVVAAYGQYIPTKVLAIPPKESLNIHPSLLPLYRGASPIQWAIANGDTETGCTILYVSKEMDAGDIVRQEREVIRPDDTTESLQLRLAKIGARLLLDAIRHIQLGGLPRVPQDHARATLVHKLTKQDGLLDWHQPARILECRTRAFTPWPSTFSPGLDTHPGALKVLRAAVVEGRGSPGEILAITPSGPVVATGDQALCLLSVQPEGRKAMDGKSYVNGYRLRVGDRFL